MTVKDLIERLNEWDPNAEVRIGRYCGPVDWSIKGISLYVHSPLENQYSVYLACDNRYKSEDVPQTSLLPEKTDIAV